VRPACPFTSLLDDASGNADTNDPKTPQDIGLGFTLGRGYSLVWVWLGF
jgi:hypothetical protein